MKVLLAMMAMTSSVILAGCGAKTSPRPPTANEVATDPSGSLSFDAQGNTKNTIVVTLERPPGLTASLPSCIAPYPSDSVLAVAKCQGNSSATINITAAQVQQECLANIQNPTQTLTMPGCVKANVYVVQRDPAVQLQIISP